MPEATQAPPDGPCELSETQCEQRWQKKADRAERMFGDLPTDMAGGTTSRNWAAIRGRSSSSSPEPSAGRVVSEKWGRYRG